MVTLPRDLDIFFRSGSSTQPEIAASDQGSRPSARWERRTSLNSQVRMISCACGCRSYGKTRSNRSGSPQRSPAIHGVSDEVAQVSSTSRSALNPPGRSRWSAVNPGGTSTAGSTGSVSGRSTSSYETSPTAEIRYQTGIGTP